jgi:nucleotide-binding universal stress UspA family protein
MDDGRPRVVVGVSTSIAGLAALRFAVTEAGRRQVRLYAVRAWYLHPSWQTTEYRTLRTSLAVEAADTVRAAFDAALGGVPPGLPVAVISAGERADRALLRFAGRPEDLLVLGGRTGLRWTSWIVRSCLRQATCPVTVVPPPELARAVDRPFSVRALIRDIERQT